jgi:glucose/arabinose dehydrogenase
MDLIMKNKFLAALFLIHCSIHAAEVNHLVVPIEFKASLFANNLEAPRQIAEGKKGYIFVGSKKGIVYALKDNDKNGQIDDVKIIFDGLNDSSGVAYSNGSLFIAEIDKLWRVDNIEDNLDNFSNKPLEKILVTDDLPSDQWHGRKWIMIDEDGSILLNIGAPCNVCLKEDERYATIIRFQENRWIIEARGVRNSVGFDKNPINGKLYFTDNGRDWLGDSMPSCELNVLEESGDFFGFPYLHASNVKDPEFGNDNHGYEINKPILDLGPHVAPTGIEFYTSNTFPAEYKNNAFITLHGSWNSSKKVGYKVIRVIFDDAGHPISVTDFVTGFLDDQKVLGRPAAPFMLSDGSLLISDDHANAIYRISPSL